MENNKQTYVFDNTEVTLTGRKAIRQIKLSSKTVEDILLEIEPLDKSGLGWKKWVKPNDLYMVH